EAEVEQLEQAEGYKSAAATVTDYRRLASEARQVGLTAVGVVLVLSLAGLLVNLARRWRQALLFCGAAAGCAVLLVLGWRDDVDPGRGGGRGGRGVAEAPLARVPVLPDDDVAPLAFDAKSEAAAESKAAPLEPPVPASGYSGASGDVAQSAPAVPTATPPSRGGASVDPVPPPPRVPGANNGAAMKKTKGAWGMKDGAKRADKPGVPVRNVAPPKGKAKASTKVARGRETDAKTEMQKRRLAGAQLRKQSNDRDKGDKADEALPLIVREYARTRGNNGSAMTLPGGATLCWQPVLVLPGGETTVSFDAG